VKQGIVDFDRVHNKIVEALLVFVRNHAFPSAQFRGSLANSPACCASEPIMLQGFQASENPLDERGGKSGSPNVRQEDKGPRSGWDAGEDPPPKFKTLSSIAYASA
jgi:hypothetical protein